MLFLSSHGGERLLYEAPRRKKLGPGADGRTQTQAACLQTLSSWPLCDAASWCSWPSPHPSAPTEATQDTDEETERQTKKADDFATVTPLVSDGVWLQSLFSRKTEKYTEIAAQSGVSVGARTGCCGRTKKGHTQQYLRLLHHTARTESIQ
ncbi:hypothetical protein HJG60_011538 [Phyllostomus discolor]|uniref:Uncharacterized protein n=1 Tax=Phyllostomus discolor TaxID=89673 RepID=A0A833ZMX7_9CHIR|nr:hypothetical protein HJG60_011538 [Phyllostomus discolor]